MYSVVLACALTAGGQTLDGHGCHACSGTCYGSCYGNAGIDGVNCCGGCYGYWGGAYSGYGGCHGCWGSYGWGGACNGGCYGSAYPWDWSSYGCNGCWGGYGAASPYFVQSPPVAAPVPAVPPAGGAEPLPPPKKPGESAAPTKARLIVDLPADARLYVDDHAMKPAAGRRSFQTPDLEAGQTYFYEVRVEVQHDGQTVSETKRVLVKAGEEAHADFTGMAATATAKAK